MYLKIKKTKKMFETVDGDDTNELSDIISKDLRAKSSASPVVKQNMNS
jgi:hypothetical protein